MCGLLLGGGCSTSRHKTQAVGSAGSGSVTTAPTAATSTTAATHTTVDLTKLPLGDQKFTTTAKQGSVFSCITQFNGGGAFKDGPWIHTDSKTWDATAKIAVAGSVKWNGQISGKESAGGEALTGNGLPTVPTGVDASPTGAPRLTAIVPRWRSVAV